MRNVVRSPLDPHLVEVLGRPQPTPRLGRSAVHRDVRGVAREAAGQLYDQLMADDAIWKEWQGQNPGASKAELERRFIAKNWPRCVPFARATMAHLLTLSTVDSRTKECIMDALVKDASLRVGRTAPAGLKGTEA